MSDFKWFTSFIRLSWIRNYQTTWFRELILISAITLQTVCQHFYFFRKWHSQSDKYCLVPHGITPLDPMWIGICLLQHFQLRTLIVKDNGGAVFWRLDQFYSFHLWLFSSFLLLNLRTMRRNQTKERKIKMIEVNWR